ncbi:PREDICTED: uncharacterized protein LOC109466602 [Branchiostoma belcheri]|uniref:Uncharacterized protein LOC109466602 n=1 Tax=Branchiostoma belcheri TaxID=7741 RepID=A0A6P4YRP6_BRABE|nr:PREDICTED: uncharacterized protein LOC109466602 [Branchiostoma belcheri]
METEDDDYGGITTSALNGGTEEEISYRQRILEEIALRLRELRPTRLEGIAEESAEDVADEEEDELKKENEEIPQEIRVEDGSVEDETEPQKDEATATTSVSGEDDIEKCIVEGLPKAAEVVTVSEETKDHPKPHPEEGGTTSQQVNFQENEAYLLKP